MDDIWGLLIPRYLSDFFGLWYSGMGVAVYTTLLIVPPCPLFRKLLGLLACRWNRPKNGLPQLVVVLRDASEWRSSWYDVLLLGLGLTYVTLHYFICHDPNCLADGSASLRRLNAADLETLRQFLYRWAALGWGMMVFSLASFLNWLDRGLEKAQPKSIKTGPSLAVWIERGGGVDYLQFYPTRRKQDRLPIAIRQDGSIDESRQLHVEHFLRFQYDVNADTWRYRRLSKRGVSVTLESQEIILGGQGDIQGPMEFQWQVGGTSLSCWVVAR